MQMRSHLLILLLMPLLATARPFEDRHTFFEPSFEYMAACVMPSSLHGFTIGLGAHTTRTSFVTRVAFSLNPYHVVNGDTIAWRRFGGFSQEILYEHVRPGQPLWFGAGFTFGMLRNTWGTFHYVDGMQEFIRTNVYNFPIGPLLRCSVGIDRVRFCVSVKGLFGFADENADNNPGRPFRPVIDAGVFYLL
jgi:hypothetical protein